MEKKEALCVPCLKSGIGRRTPLLRLAVWCDRCYDPQQLASGVCGSCLEKGKGECANCKAQDYLVKNVCSVPQCTRHLRLCRACHSVQASSKSISCTLCHKQKLDTCNQCGSNDDIVDKSFFCEEATCAARLQFCGSCVSVATGVSEVLCKRCWRAAGQFCVSCRIAKARLDRESLRFCYKCAKVRRAHCILTAIGTKSKKVVT